MACIPKHNTTQHKQITSNKACDIKSNKQRWFSDDSGEVNAKIRNSIQFNSMFAHFSISISSSSSSSSRALLSSSTKLRTPSSSSKDHSFTLNYLINNCGFPPETASKLCKRVHLHNSQNPDSILAFFRSYGFSDAQLLRIIQTCPVLLSFDPNKTLLPKFNFFLSKGASTSDIVQIVSKNPWFLYYSLEKTITPCYDLLKRFMLSDESTIKSLKHCTSLIYSKSPAQNVQLLLRNGVPESKVASLFSSMYYIFEEKPDAFEKTVEELKELGFKPSTTFFVVALRAKCSMKTVWQKKIDLYKKWGWSEDVIDSAFRRYPWCMLASVDNIEAVMQFFVNHMGWDSLIFAKCPILLLMSLERRLIPRAFLLQFLESKGVIENAKALAAFQNSEAEFLDKYVNCFEKEEASQLLKLYEDKKKTNFSLYDEETKMKKKKKKKKKKNRILLA